MNPEPRHLGDGVYANVDELDRIVLTTGSHVDADADHRIVFEPEMLVAFVQFIEHFTGDPIP